MIKSISTNDLKAHSLSRSTGQTTSAGAPSASNGSNSGGAALLLRYTLKALTLSPMIACGYKCRARTQPDVTRAMRRRRAMAHEGGTRSIISVRTVRPIDDRRWQCYTAVWAVFSAPRAAQRSVYSCNVCDYTLNFEEVNSINMCIRYSVDVDIHS
jgi:hypothetical protein